MKITKIHIAAFGGLKNFSLELNDGLNVIYGDNEDGKSTIMAFIKAMFYGTGKKTQSLENSPRVKYEPWSGDTMCGRIYFEHGGKRYCLEREFRKSDATDRITLTDTDTGVLENVSSDIGSRFFGVGVDAFEKSAFIGILSLAGKKDNLGQIDNKLSNLSTTGDEDTSFLEITERIMSAKEKIISKSGRTGSFVKGTEQLNALKERLTSCEDAAAQKARLTLESEQLRNDAHKLIAEYNDLKKLMDSKDDITNIQKLKNYLEIKSQLDLVNTRLKTPDGAVIDDIFIKKIEFCNNKVLSHKEKIKGIQEEIEKINNTIMLSDTQNLDKTKAEFEDIKGKIDALHLERDALDKNVEEASNYADELQRRLTTAEKAKKAFNPLFGVIAILSAAIGVVLVNVSLWVAISLFSVAVITLILSFVILPNNKAEALKLQAELNKALNSVTEIKNTRVTKSEELNLLIGRLNILTSALNTDNALQEQRRLSLNEKLTFLEEENEHLSLAQRDLALILDKLRFDNQGTESFADAISNLKEVIEQQKTLKLKLNYICNDLGGISYEEAEKRLNSAINNNTDKNVDFDLVKNRIEEITEVLSNMKTEITKRETELKTAFRDFENPENIKKEIDVLKETLASQQEFCKASLIAVEVLEESNNEMRRSYGGLLEEKTAEIFSGLTGGKYTSLSVSKDMDIFVEEKERFGKRDIGYLSQGTADQAYLSLRLAISQLISKDEAIPIILDDALSQYDDSRTINALNFLKNYCKNNQGILFTCHNDIYQNAIQNNISCKRLHDNT